MAEESPPERLVYAILGWLLARSAGTALNLRELTFEDGSIGRWLRPDIKRFERAVELQARAIRRIDAARPDAFGSRLMVEMTVRTIAAYRALIDAGVDRSCARKLVADVGWDIYSKMLNLYSWPFRLTTHDPSKRISRTIKALLWFPFNPRGAAGYEVQHWEAEGNTYTHFTHCPPQSFVRALIASGDERGDLEAFRESWCRYDWPGADILAGDGARGHYERRQTLSHGDSVCDMCRRARVEER